MNKVHAIIVNYHRQRLTEQAVASVLASGGVDVRVILIDNDSDGAWVRKRYDDHSRVHPIVNTRNIGFGAACNQGIEFALGDGADFVFLLNNDAVVEPDTLAMLADAADGPGMATPKILLPDGRIWAAGGHVEVIQARCRNRGIYETDHGQYDRPDRMIFASACALMLARPTLETGARFFEPFFLYYEDADLCLHLAQHGFRVAYTPTARVIHHESASTAPEHTARLAYYDMRNRWVFLRRHGSLIQRLVGGAWLMAVALGKSLRYRTTGRRAHARALMRGLADGMARRLGPLSVQ